MRKGVSVAAIVAFLLSLGAYADMAALPATIHAGAVAQGVTVTIGVDGSGTTDPEPGTYDFSIDDVVSVTAIPDEGFELDRWEVDGENRGNEGILYVTIEGSVSITAVFVEEGSGGGGGPGDCLLESVTSISPIDGAFISILEGSEALGIVLAATTNCLADTSDVYFEIDEEQVADLFGPTLSDIFQTFTPPVSELGAGDHALRTVATDLAAEVTVETSAAFSIISQSADTDADENGLPDAPCDILSLPGDYWYSVVNIAATGLDRLSTATLWYAGEDPVVALHEPDNAGMYVAAHVPDSLLLPGEVGILILQKALDLDTLYGPDEAAVLAALPGDLLPDSEVFEICILVSSEGCDGFAPIDESRLADNPIYIVMEGFSLPPDPFLYVHPTSCSIDAETGLQVFATEGEWSTDPVTELTLTEGRMEATVTSMSAFALVEPTAVPILDVSPTDTVDFGCVILGDTDDVTFTVTNIGDGTLEGEAVTSGVFSIVGDASWSLGADESVEITVRFSPTEAGEVTGEVSFGGEVFVTLVGTGRDIPCDPFACLRRSNVNRSADSRGDIALLGLAGLGLLIPATKRRLKK